MTTFCQIGMCANFIDRIPNWVHPAGTGYIDDLHVVPGQRSEIHRLGGFIDGNQEGDRMTNREARKNADEG